MRLLFEIDTKDYNINGTTFSRPSSRAIIIKDNKIAMIHSLKYNYYKFPGGGIEKDETKEEALIREVEEESGLVVIPSTIKEYGYVHRIQKGKNEDVFIQDNYYYLCECYDEIRSQNLCGYEIDEKFTLELIHPRKAIECNMNVNLSMKSKEMIEREIKVLKLLIKEKYIEG